MFHKLQQVDSSLQPKVSGHMRLISPYSELFIRCIPRCQSSEALVALRQATSRSLRDLTSSFKRTLQHGIASLIWPVVASVQATKLVWQHGHWAWRESGRPPFKQWMDMILAILTDCRVPRDYYFYRHFMPEQRALAPFYLSLREACRMFCSFNGPQHIVLLKDKSQFARHCRAHGLPTPEVLANFRNHQVEHDGQPGGLVLPACDLFAKRIDSTGGKGAHRWEYLSPDQYRDHKGKLFTAQQIIEHLKEVSTPDQPHLLQRRIVNTTFIAKLSNGSLATLRVMTVRPGPGQPPVYLRGILRLPHGDGITDNQAQETPAILCPIDEATGRVGVGRLMRIRGATCTHHPDTHEPIEGITIPDWPTIKAFCVEAHEKLWPYSTVGWDIALTPQGLEIIEANHVPSVETVQIAHAKPLGNTLQIDSLLHFARAME